MTNLQKAAEQGNQAAPNLLDAIKAGEIGGGGSSFEKHTYIRAIATSQSELEVLISKLPSSNNIIGISQSFDNQETFALYSNYKDWLDPYILFFEAALDYAKSELLDDEIAIFEMILSQLNELKAQVQLNTVSSFSSSQYDNALMVIYSLYLFPSLGYVQFVFLDTDNAPSNISAYTLGDATGEGIIGVPITPPANVYSIAKAYMLNSYALDTIDNSKHTLVCYVNAGKFFDQIISDKMTSGSTQDLADVPKIIGANYGIRYDGFIIKGTSNGVEAALACVHSLNILSVTFDDNTSQELQAKITAYAALVEATPDKYVCTNDIELCEYIEKCLSFYYPVSNDDLALYGPSIRKNVLRTAVVADGTADYAYVSEDLLFCFLGRPQAILFTNDGGQISSTLAYYIPSPLK